jgi:hypothetical protein
MRKDRLHLRRVERRQRRDRQHDNRPQAADNHRYVYVRKLDDVNHGSDSKSRRETIARNLPARRRRRQRHHVDASNFQPAGTRAQQQQRDTE